MSVWGQELRLEWAGGGVLSSLWASCLLPWTLRQGDRHLEASDGGGTFSPATWTQQVSQGKEKGPWVRFGSVGSEQLLLREAASPFLFRLCSGHSPWLFYCTASSEDWVLPSLPRRLSLAALSSWPFCDPHLSHRPPPGGRGKSLQLPSATQPCPPLPGQGPGL